jgi:cystathionine beta-lyase/cystathionine gamma-synthase
VRPASEVTDVHSLLVHGDRAVGETTAVTPPIWQTANFFHADAEAFDREATRIHPGHFYTRYGNPNSTHVEALVTQLEGTEAAFCTASGIAAMSLAVLAHVRAGGHVVAQTSHYIGTSTLLDHVLPGFGVTVTRVDQTNSEAFAAAVTPATRLFVLETPSNPRLELTDLAEVCKIARRHEIVTILDSTFATPLNCQPARLGVDIVMHSATKYLAGHSDVIAGVLAGSTKSINKIWKLSIVLGTPLGPFDAWLLLRGLRTLALRVAQQNRNACLIAAFLESHPRVAAVHYPGLPSHPQHALAKRQMTGGFGGIVSFEVRGGRDAAARVVSRLQMPRVAPSVGGVSSLVAMPAALWKSETEGDKADATGFPSGLIRYATGIEAADDLIADLDSALNG